MASIIDDPKEIRAASRLDHPNIVKVHEFLPGYSAIVMDLVEGTTLTRRMAEDPQWVRDRFYKLFLPLVDAIRLAHANKIIHRDIKPDNILVDKNGNLKLTDFGVCAILDSTDYTDGRAGSPPYMAPEALNGEEYNSEADVHSLGCVFYEVWTGRRPWIPSGRGLMSYVASKANDLPEPLRTQAVEPVSDLLSDLVGRMISVRPERRIRRIDLVSQLLTLCDPSPADTSRTLERLSARLGGIYGFKNDNRDPLYLIGQLLVSTRALGHQILSAHAGRPEIEIEATFPKTFAWISAVASSVNVGLSQLIQLKFDGVCPYCSAQVCQCERDWVTGKETRNEKLLASVRDRRLITPSNSLDFEEYRAMFDRTFGESNRNQGSTATLLHMYSEIAEATDAILHLLPDDDEYSLLVLHLEISDLIAWFYALVNIYHHNHKDFDFVERFDELFSDGCYACRSHPCVCPEPVGVHNWKYVLTPGSSDD